MAKKAEPKKATVAKPAASAKKTPAKGGGAAGAKAAGTKAGTKMGAAPGAKAAGTKMGAAPGAKSGAKSEGMEKGGAGSKSTAPAKGGVTGGEGTKAKPWMLTTPSGSSEYQMYKDESGAEPVLVCTVGKTELRYQWRALEDLRTMLKAHGDWMPLGSADEQKPAAEGTVEAWGRAETNPVGGWYGMKKGLRGRFGMYIPPLMERLSMAEVEHNPKNNRMRAK